jgi:hypothetical protein
VDKWNGTEEVEGQLVCLILFAWPFDFVLGNVMSKLFDQLQLDNIQQGELLHNHSSHECIDVLFFLLVTGMM